MPAEKQAENSSDQKITFTKITMNQAIDSQIKGEYFQIKN
jgi:hypothetical protein